MQTKFIIVRHGHSVANQAAIYAAHTDVPLSEIGRKQAERLGEYLKETPIDAVYSSDLQRAHDTVAPVASTHGLVICDRKELREIFGGDWEGKKYDDLLKEYPEEYGLWLKDVGKSRCVGGESVKELSERILKELSRIAAAHPDETVLIATHATAVRAICTAALGLPVEEMKEVPWVGNASVSIFTYQGGKLTPIKLSDTAHLVGLTTEFPKNV